MLPDCRTPQFTLLGALFAEMRNLRCDANDHSVEEVEPKYDIHLNGFLARFERPARSSAIGLLLKIIALTWNVLGRERSFPF
jgi:hypothetical protein